MVLFCKNKVVFVGALEIEGEREVGGGWFCWLGYRDMPDGVDELQRPNCKGGQCWWW